MVREITYRIEHLWLLVVVQLNCTLVILCYRICYVICEWWLINRYLNFAVCLQVHGANCVVAFGDLSELVLLRVIGTREDKTVYYIRCV